MCVRLPARHKTLALCSRRGCWLLGGECHHRCGHSHHKYRPRYTRKPSAEPNWGVAAVTPSEASRVPRLRVLPENFIRGSIIDTRWLASVPRSEFPEDKTARCPSGSRAWAEGSRRIGAGHRRERENRLLVPDIYSVHFAASGVILTSTSLEGMNRELFPTMLPIEISTLTRVRNIQRTTSRVSPAGSGPAIRSVRGNGPRACFSAGVDARER